MNDAGLTGRTAIVTGGSRGIGLATAHTLASAGGNVVLTSRSQESAEAAAAEVNDAGVAGTALGVGAHAVDGEAAERCVALAIERFGSLDVLVNNAGTNPAYGPVCDQTHAQFTKTFEVNLWAPMLWTALATRAWMSQNGGCVINMASIGGLAIAPDLGVYNASKAALIYLTKQLAFELSPNVRVNAIAPGIVRTRLAEVLFRDKEEAVGASTAVGRIGEPADVAGVVEFLASDAASWITGETIVIDGGQSLGDVLSFRKSV